MAATDLYLIRKTQQWAKYSAVEALSLTGAATSDEVEVWSAEFRDIFSSTINVSNTGLGSVSGATAPAPSLFTGPGVIAELEAVYTGVSGTLTGTPTIGAESDELAHADLRQTKLPRTMWKFDRGAAATPRYLYAYVQEGDIIADNPPETE